MKFVLFARLLGAAFSESLSDGASTGEDFKAREYVQTLSQKTPFHEVDVEYDADHNNTILLVDGNVRFSTHGGWGLYHEMMTHVPLQALSAPVQSVLVFGGVTGGVTGNVLQHQHIRKVVQVERDAQAVNTARRFFPHFTHAFDDPRVELHLMDASRWVQQHSRLNAGVFDACIIDTTDPAVRSLDFLTAMQGLLKPGGLVMQNAGTIYELSNLTQFFSVHRRIFPFVHPVLLSNINRESPNVAFLSSATLRCAVPPPIAMVRGCSLPAEWYSTEAHRVALALPQWAPEYFPELRSDSLGCLIDNREQLHEKKPARLMRSARVSPAGTVALDVQSVPQGAEQHTSGEGHGSRPHDAREHAEMLEELMQREDLACSSPYPPHGCPQGGLPCSSFFLKTDEDKLKTVGSALDVFLGYCEARACRSRAECVTLAADAFKPLLPRENPFTPDHKFCKVLSDLLRVNKDLKKASQVSLLSNRAGKKRQSSLTLDDSMNDEMSGKGGHRRSRRGKR